MSNLNPRIERLKAMLGLEEKRAALQSQLDAIQEQLVALKEQLFDESTTPIKASPARIPASRKGRSKRGALKEQIMAALSNAGDGGVKVTELAAVLGTKPANIHAWFHSTGKSVPGLVKLSGGHYRLKEGAFAATPESSSPKTSSKSKSRGSKPAKGSKRGLLSSNIISALEAAGDKGLKIKELAEQIGANYRNVAVWFVTTGKNFPKVKKVAAAHYKVTS